MSDAFEYLDSWDEVSEKVREKMKCGIETLIIFKEIKLTLR